MMNAILVNNMANNMANNIVKSRRNQEGLDVIRHTFCIDYGVDTSLYLKELEEINQKGEAAKYVDERFPPTRESLCSNWDDITDANTKKSWEQITWMRPSQFMQGNISVFDNIEPSDIKQGLLGDCYFLCSLSSLAERPNLIRRLFETKTYQINGLYSIWLNIDGEWRNYVVDDFIPCKNGKPAFSRANGNELWVLLLEKAYAKAYGSYFKIEGGNPAIALRDLTGAPYVNFDEKNADLMFNFLKEHDQSGNGDILTCYTSPTSVREESTKVGLYSGHAYSILDVKEIQDRNRNIIRLVKIRNPWGNGEWNGAWSDSSPLWDTTTLSQVNVRQENDGTFYMCIEDFVEYFEGVGASQVIDTNLYNSISFKLLGKQNQSIAKLQLLQPASSLTITLNQKDTRFYPEGSYSYSFVTLILVRKTDSDVFYIGSSFEYDRNVRICALNVEPGEYLILTEVAWCQDHYRNLVLSCYSEAECKFSFVLQGLDFNQVQQQAIKSYCQFSRNLPQEQQKVKISEYNGTQIGRMNGSDFGILFFYFYNFSYNTTLIQTMSFSKLIGYAMPNYYTDKDSVKVIVPPQREQVLCFKFNAIADYRTEYSFKSSLQMLNKDECKETPNPKVFLEKLGFIQVLEKPNIEAKDRKLADTNFKLGIDQIDSNESAVTVYPCEIAIINFLSSLVAPFIKDWPSYLFMLTLLYGVLLMFFSFDNCNHLDIVLIMTCYIFFSAQVATRKRLRKILLVFFASTFLSLLWFFIFPLKWNSIDFQYKQASKAWKVFIPIAQLAFIVIKFYLSLIYWKVFVCYDQLIGEVYSRFSNSRKEIYGI